MVAAKPIDAFLLGERQVLSCQLPSGDPESLRDRDFAFVSPGCEPKWIRIVGWSTASDLTGNLYDLQYTGDRIHPDDITDQSFLAEAERVAHVASDHSNS